MNTLIQFFEEMYEDQSGGLGRVKRYILYSEFKYSFLIKDLMLLEKMPPFSFLKSTVRIFSL